MLLPDDVFLDWDPKTVLDVDGVEVLQLLPSLGTSFEPQKLNAFFFFFFFFLDNNKQRSRENIVAHTNTAWMEQKL